MADGILSGLTEFRHLARWKDSIAEPFQSGNDPNWRFIARANLFEHGVTPSADAMLLTTAIKLPAIHWPAKFARKNCPHILIFLEW